jgi:hypothetical protein
MSETWKIERGIPIPPTRFPGKFSKYPYGQMEVGESVFMEIDSHSASAASYRHRPKRFSVRQTTENGKHGTRVWRIA